MEFLKVWTSFRQIIAPLTDEEKGRLFDAMLLYAESGEEPDQFTGNERFLWQVAKQDIDRTAARNETLRQNGLKGGRPKNNASQEKPNETKENQSEPNESCKVKKSNIKKDNVKNNSRGFTPPSLEEVTAYCQERKNNVDPERFIAFYASKGWKVGNQPMKDWKACVITWEKRDSSPRPVKTVTAQQYEQRDYTGVQDELLERQRLEIEAKLKAKGQKRVIAQMYEQRDYSGVQQELMAEQDREMEEFMKHEAG